MNPYEDKLCKLFYSGMLQLQNHNYQGAIKSFSSHLNIVLKTVREGKSCNDLPSDFFQTHLKAHYFRAICYFQLKDFDKACYDYGEALELYYINDLYRSEDVYDFDILHNRGIVYSEMGNYEYALSNYESAKTSVELELIRCSQTLCSSGRNKVNQLKHQLTQLELQIRSIQTIILNNKEPLEDGWPSDILKEIRRDTFKFDNDYEKDDFLEKVQSEGYYHYDSFYIPGKILSKNQKGFIVRQEREIVELYIDVKYFLLTNGISLIGYRELDGFCSEEDFYGIGITKKSNPYTNAFNKALQIEIEILKKKPIDFVYKEIIESGKYQEKRKKEIIREMKKMKKGIKKSIYTLLVTTLISLISLVFILLSRFMLKSSLLFVELTGMALILLSLVIGLLALWGTLITFVFFISDVWRYFLKCRET